MRRRLSKMAANASWTASAAGVACVIVASSAWSADYPVPVVVTWTSSATTCVVKAGLDSTAAGATANLSVAFGNVGLRQLGDISVTRAFNISATECVGTVATFAPFFTLQPANALATTVANVVVDILLGDGTPVALSQPPGAQGIRPAPVNGPIAFQARLRATGPPGRGAINAALTYTINYQ